ncbi:DUF637 domain-containing protein [Paraburkholderia xenovorans]
MSRTVGGTIPTPVAGKASYVDGSLGASAIGNLSPQDLLTALPANLQPGSTLFYYNPQEEDLLLQQAALQQTGKASFIDGLTYDSKTNTSVTEQEKAYLYQNPLDYAKANNLQLGDALTQTQINALDKPMLWYVEQTVPDPSCTATGTATCPTITALMPQVYLPSDTSAMSAGGNISGTDVTLNFGKGSGGSILNTGSITASDTLTVNTDSLTNQANQVDIGQIWSKVKGGYVEETGTVVQPGGFMSAANMDLNVQTLDQIGGALQKLNADGTVDQAGTQQMLAALQTQLGSNFTQTSLSDNLHTDFVKEGGGLPTFVVAAIAIAASIVTAGAAAAAMGATMASMTLGQSIVVGALSGMAGSAASQIASGNGLDFGALLEAGAVGALTAGLTNGITYNSTTGSLGLGNLDQGLNSLPQNVSTLGQLAGISNIGNSLGQVAQAGSVAASNLPGQLIALGATATINAGVETAIEGGSFLNHLQAVGISDVAAVGAYEIGNTSAPLSLQNVLEHAALGCIASAASGSGCGGGAIGGAASAVVSPLLLGVIDPTHAPLDNGQLAALSAFATLAGGGLAALAGVNTQGAATTALNEALNNTAEHWDKPGQQKEAEKFTVSPTAPQTSTDPQQAQQGGGGNSDPEAVTVGKGTPALAAGATNNTAGSPSSTYDTSITNAGSEYLNVKTNVTADQFESNLISNGYSVTNQGTNKNGSFTVLNNGTSTYTIYTRTTTGQAGGQYFGPGGVSAKFSLNPK